jgi:hypothetical protein
MTEVTTTLTPFQLTPLGLFHTLVSLVAVAAALLALFIDRTISPRTAVGRFYLVTLFVTTVTGLPIFRHGGIGPAHIVGVLTLVALAVAAVSERTSLFGCGSAYVSAISLFTTVLFLMIPAVTETLTRVPIAAPIASGADAPILKMLNAILLALYLLGVAQARRVHAAGAPLPGVPS